MTRAGILVALALLAGCGTHAKIPTSPTATAPAPYSSAAESPASSPTPTLAELTPAPTGEAAFDYDASRVPVPVEKKREQRGSATVLDLEWVSDWGETMRAYLVLPAGAEPVPAVVYLHWLGSDATANRTEFLDEGVAIAGRGLASLHIQGRFPWVESPSGVEKDRAGILGQLIDMRRGVDYLAARPDIDPSRLAVVGHDFGAMYGPLLARVDNRLDGVVVMAGVPHWADWFVRYWHPLAGLSESDYRALLVDLDPVTAVPAIAPRPILFQWAALDSFVDEQHRDEFIAAAGPPKESKVYDTVHPLDDPAATSDRDAWLIHLLSPAGG